MKLQFHLDDNHRRVIEGEIETEVSVMCQRCLEPAQIHLADSFSLGIVETESHIARLPDSLDPWMVTDQKLVIADFVEEQLILAMPIVCYHAEGCKAASAGGNAESSDGNAVNEKNRKVSPFAILQKLKEPQ